jgi:NAD(P)-dependent dehydrogenase (short-subunit alcohol dehydrogenase family)
MGLNFFRAVVFLLSLYVGFTYAHKTVLITGGVSGLGREMAQTFNDDGWDVWVTSRSVKNTPSNSMDTPLPENIKQLQVDLTDPLSIENAIARVQAQSGKIDVLINNAGYGLLGPVETASSAQVCDEFAVNVFAPLNLSKLVIPIMRENGGGRIINISSTSGMRAVPGLGVYAASKMALEGLSEAMNAELQPWNIQVAMLQPGTVKNSWAENTTVTDSSNSNNLYSNLSNNLKNLLKEKAREGQQPSEIGLLALQIAKDETPKFRYQTNEQSFNVAKEVWNDPTGNSMQTKMSDFAKKLYG